MRAILASGLDLLNTLMGDSETPSPVFLWKGVEIPCVPNDASYETAVFFGGKEQRVVLRLFVKLSNFLTADSTLVTVDDEVYSVDNDRPRPINGNKLTYLGRVYRVVSNEVAATRSHVSMSLADPHAS